jgi:hypothetical protein
MGDELLNAILQLENRIQQQSLREQQRADRWLAGVRAEQQLRLEQARREFAAAEGQALEQGRRQGEERAAQLLAAEREYCARLEDLSEAALQALLDRQLSKILPGHVDDHQDGEG